MGIISKTGNEQIDDRKLKQYLLQEVVQIQSKSSQKSEREQHQIASKSANNIRLLLNNIR
jgi:hypothetical protein